jgi:hypothetical protein
MRFSERSTCSLNFDVKYFKKIALNATDAQCQEHCIGCLLWPVPCLCSLSGIDRPRIFHIYMESICLLWIEENKDGEPSRRWKFWSKRIKIELWGLHTPSMAMSRDWYQYMFEVWDKGVLCEKFSHGISFDYTSIRSKYGTKVLCARRLGYPLTISHTQQLISASYFLTTVDVDK